MSLVAAIVCAFLFAWFLPNIPYFNRLVLKPPGEEADGHPDLSAVGYVAPSLLGAIGVAVTTLRPSGKAQFGDEFLDVIAEGDYVNAEQPGPGHRDRREPHCGEGGLGVFVYVVAPRAMARNVNKMAYTWTPSVTYWWRRA